MAGLIDYSITKPELTNAFAAGYSGAEKTRNALLEQQQQRQLSDLQYKNALREQQGAISEQEAWKAGGNDLAKIQQQLMQRGLGKQAMAVGTQLQAQQKAKLEQLKSSTELMKSTATRIMAQPDPVFARNALVSFGQQTGADITNDLAELDSLGGNPKRILAWATSHAVSADKMLPKFESFTVPGVGVQTGTTDYTGQFKPGPSFAEQLSPYQQGQLKIAQGNLGVARERLKQEGQSVTYQTDAEGDTIALPTKLAPGVVPTARSVMAPGGGVLPLKSPKDKGAAVSEQQAAYNIGRVLTAATQIGDISKKDPNAVQPGAGEAFAASIGMGGTANLARNANRQIVYGAQRDALDALLYLATGAAYNKEQLEGLATAYIPSYTDEPTTVVAKRERMTELINNAKVRAGKAWTPKMDAAMQALTNPTAAKAPAKATSGWGKAVEE